MNWYKIALTEKEFYDFYGYSLLTEENLKDNPVILYDMIDHLNYIRGYYLTYLVSHISSEIYHAEGKIISKKNSIEEILTLKEQEELLKIRTKTRRNFNNNKYTNLDFENAEKIFRDYYWYGAYGGEAWGIITEWTKKLYNIGEISQEEFGMNLFNKIQKLIMAIDTIHSLEHNTIRFWLSCRTKRVDGWLWH